MLFERSLYVTSNAHRLSVSPPRRRNITAARANHERWMMSYADFVTLLFALFVVMFASSEANTDKAKRVSEAVEQALGVVSIPHGDPKLEPGLSASFHQLQKQLAPEIQTGKVKMSLQQRGLVVTLNEAGFFKPGDDAIQPDSLPAFKKLAGALRILPNPIRLEGHTDSVPIHTQRFRNNWDLSTARSLAVLALLEENYDIPRGRLSAAGYADTVPLESNESDAGKSHNRRVDLVVLSPHL